MPLPGTGYGPMMLSLLEYTARRLGITPLADGVGGALLFSALHLAEGNAVATQRLGDRTFSLASERDTAGVVQANATIGRGGSLLFRLSCRAADSSAPLVGVRVVIGLAGDHEVRQLVGIANTTQQVRLTVGERAAPLGLRVRPNEVWGLSEGGPVREEAAPFVAPHS